MKTILKKIVLSVLFLSLISFSSKAQYCLPTYSFACSSADYINNFSTTGGISNITNNNTGCNGAAPNNYTFNSTMSASQIQGLNLNFSVQSGSSWSQGFRIWIDWNQDLDFADPGEDVFVSTSSSTAVQTGTITVPMWAIPGPTRMRVMCRYATIPLITDYCSTSLSFGETEDYIMNVIPATPCTGTPNAGSAFPVSQTLCAGQSVYVSLTGATYQGNMAYQWQQSTNGGTTWTNAVGGSGATSPYYQTPTLNSSIMYRNIFTCIGSGMSDTSDPATINISGPVYASLPFTEDFEIWSNYCNASDVPYANSVINWVNSPSSGNNSWRKFTDGSTANWSSPNYGAYIPGSSTGLFSARFHSSYTSASGSLDLFLDCSQQIGNKTLFFDYINNGGSDFLEMLVSTDGGLTFTSQGSFYNATNWTNNNIIISSNSATTVVRFKATGDNMTTDIGLDNIVVVEPCTGTPNAGAIVNITPCANSPFNLTLTGNTLVGNMTYTWESAPSATGPWTNVTITAIPTATTTIPVATYFRCIVTCLASGLSDTTAPQLIDIGPFYYCYCLSQSTVLSYPQNIGHIIIKDAQGNSILDNGIAAPVTNNPSPLHYNSTFYNLVPFTIYRDSTYSIDDSCFTQDSFFENGYSNVYIDYNRDGSFDPITELATGGVVNGPSGLMVGNFVVPSTAQYGLTGLRIVYQVLGTSTSVSPCGSYPDGETEDYIVEIKQAPCVNPPYAGIANISDTITCPGYTVNLIDTTHDLNFANLSFNWQVSNDGINFADVPLATFDTMSYTVNGNTWFRFRTNCNNTSNGYSNIVKVVMSPPASCYGISQPASSTNDSSDIGAFTITNFSTNNNIYAFITGGPHLNNPMAIRRRTDYTGYGPMDLYTDSTYNFNVYHILKGSVHADARVTIFIDYNNNQLYDIPAERVFDGIAGTSTFYLTGEIHTPVNPALYVGTGLRIVLNNDVSSNAASNNGVGLYTSGETEDYLVKFNLKPVGPNAVNNFDLIKEIGVYPNPTSNFVYIGFKAIEKTNATISILNMTGSVVMQKEYSTVNGNFVTEFNVGQLSKGTYLVKIDTDKGKFIRKLTIE